MIAQIDEQLRQMGICSPVRYTLHIQLVKLKLMAPLQGKKIQLKIQAMDNEKKIEISSSDRLISNDQINQDDEYIYSINKQMEFDLSYGVTKITIKGFHILKLGGKSLAFYNDLSLKRVLETDQILKYECQLLGESKVQQASLFVHLQRQGDAVPRYNIFAEIANRIKINQLQYLSQNPEAAAALEMYKKEQAEQKAQSEQSMESLPNLEMLKMGQIFYSFVSRVDPLVSAYNLIFNLITIKNTRDTVTFLLVLSYMIVYIDTIVCLIPIIPLIVIMFIFYNYYYEIKFVKPKTNYAQNFKLLQMIMQLTGDMFEVQYYILDNFFYWKNKEKTLLTQNILLGVSFASIPVIFVPFRYIVLAGIWGAVGMNSPFFVALMKSFIQILLEYGLVIERSLPNYMEQFNFNLEFVWIPRVQAILRWIPYVRQYVPSLNDYNKQVQSRFEQSTRFSTFAEDKKSLFFQSTRDSTIKKINESNFKRGNNIQIHDQLNNFFENQRNDEQIQITDRKTFEENYFSDEHTVEENEESEGDFFDLQKYRHDSIYEPNTRKTENLPFIDSNADIRKFETYQNQRVWLGIFKDILLPHERPNWSDKDGKIRLPKDSILLPIEGDWKWSSDWIIEKDSNFQDKHGWAYSNDFNGPFKKNRGLLDFVRRRKWVRYAQINIQNEQNLGQQYSQRMSELKKEFK